MKTPGEAPETVFEINSLLQEALGSGEDAVLARERARKLLGLDESNWAYFFGLYRGKTAGARKRTIRIHEAGKDPEGAMIAYPIAIAPRELLKSLVLADYADLRRSPERYDEAAREASLWVKKMQAGSGSSLTRTSYLARRLGIPESQVRIGAKGTDLFVDIPDPRQSGGTVSISIAEAQILQCIARFRNREMREVIFHDIVSSETEEAMRKLWDRPSLLEPIRSYRELVAATPGLSYFGTSYQTFIPTLDEAERISFKRKAPGGHALFAVDALRAAYREELRPKAQGKLISAISNGEDLNSAPDPFMLGYIVKHRVPIALVTTERTAVDLKGGLLSLVLDGQAVSLTVLETAQANAAGQGNLFAGLPGMVSTNLTLFNYDVLTPMLSREVQEIGEDEFLKIVAPDVISNTKEQRDADGVVRKYTQLEGAMGSTIMNLDRYWRKKHNKPLVQIINVDRMHRTEFFSPVKSAFDYFMQFHSDRFDFDPVTFQLRNLRPGYLPQVSLRDPATQDRFYQDVENVLRAFKGARIRMLDELEVRGRIKAQGVEFRGRVRIDCRGQDEADLNQVIGGDRGSVLEDANIEIGSEGELIRKSA